MSIDLTPPTPLWAQARAGLYQTHALEVAQAWLDSSAWGLLLLGGVGRGKSQAAAWLWLRLADEDVAQAQAPGVYRPRGGVLWLRARVLQRLEWQARAEVLRRCATAYGLVVDELGGEDQRTGEALGDVLEERGDRQARTVITTNLRPKGREEDGPDGKRVFAPGFLERYGDRLISRLRSGGVTESGRARWAVACEGADLRGVERPTPSATTEIEGPPVTPEQQAAILAEHAPGVAGLIEAARAAGGGR